MHFHLQNSSIAMKSFCQSGLCHWEMLHSNVQSSHLLKVYQVPSLAWGVLHHLPHESSLSPHEPQMRYVRPSCG